MHTFLLFNKKVYAGAWALVLLGLMPYLTWGMQSENPQSATYIQEFHEILTNVNPSRWFDPGVQAYYKKIEPITSAPEPGVHRWNFSVMVAGQQVTPRADGVYTLRTRSGDVAFSLTLPPNFEHADSVTFSVTHNGVVADVEFSKQQEEKIPVLTGFNSYHELLYDIRTNKIWWRQKVTFEGIVSIPDEEPCVIQIVSVDAYKHPLTLQGFEITYRKDHEKTEIFLDLVDASKRSLRYGTPVFSCAHKKANVDKKVICINDHRVWECNAKDITYDIFDSADSYAAWVPDTTDFYDQNKNEVTTLSSRYSDVREGTQAPREPFTWILEDGLESVYEVDGLSTLRDSNDYIYSRGDGFLHVTLPYEASFKEYLNEHNKISVRYLEQVVQPALKVARNSAFEGGHRHWPAGLYKRTRTEDTIVWQKVSDPQDVPIIQFHNDIPHQERLQGGAFEIQWPSAPHELTAQQNKEWCNAAQRFFVVFGSNIHHCDRDIVNKVANWNKLIDLDISHIKLAEGVSWAEFLGNIAYMRQLIKLRFCNNSPIANFNDDYDQLAKSALSLYVVLGQCLGRLENLRELHLQGLWLKPHQVLGDGVQSIETVSKEVAMLTGIINHEKNKGVSTVLENINRLSNLEILSMDGIPDHGSSYYSRRNGRTVAIFSPLFLVTFPFAWSDGHDQCVALKALATKYADLLARMPALKNLTVYAPGGNCTDYFSKFFRERISSSRPADLPPLSVNQAILQ